MKNNFKEYHQFTEKEFDNLITNCLFVFDTNTLLNMYRYSKDTVTAYFNVLNELRDKKQIWIPYQVGYEFYENRISVITEYENSYNEILAVFSKVIKEIEGMKYYKYHPALDLKNIKENLIKAHSGIESDIREAQEKHPKLLNNDEVLEKINLLFEGNVGDAYDEKKLNEIREDGRKRYDKKIPPGFKDDNPKSDDRKYGDLIIWNQIIDKAKACKKSIVLVSGDVKEDWWLKHNGKRIMPLPQLKKEIRDKAQVDFHIYTADKFLEIQKTITNKIDDTSINEVRKISELAEYELRKFNENINVEHGQFYINVPKRQKKTGEIPYRRVSFEMNEFRNFSELLNSIYFMISEFISPYQYGQQWILQDIETKEILNKIYATRNRDIDTRTLLEAGIKPGSEYQIIMIEPN